MFDKNDLPHELILLTTRRKLRLRNAFNNNMSTDLKLSKAQFGGFLASLLSKLVVLLMKVAIPLVKNVLGPLGIIGAASAIDTGIQKKIDGSGRPLSTTLVISIKEMKDMMNILQALEYSNIFLKGVTKTNKNETKEQKRGLLTMLLGTLGASLLGNMLAGKGIVTAGYWNKKGTEMLRACYGSKKNILITPHPLTNFEIQKYCQNETRFKGVFSRDNLPNKTKDGAYIISLE